MVLFGERLKCGDCTCSVLSGGERFLLGDVSRSFGAALYFSDLFKARLFCASHSTSSREEIPTSLGGSGGERVLISAWRKRPLVNIDVPAT